MSDRVVLAGGSGFVGRYLAERYRARGMHVTIVGRASEVTWTDDEALVERLTALICSSISLAAAWTAGTTLPIAPRSSHPGWTRPKRCIPPCVGRQPRRHSG